MISESLGQGRPLADVLPSLGVGWILVAKGTPGPSADTESWITVVDGPDLALYAAPGPVDELRAPQHLGLVAATDLAVLGGLIGGLVALGFRRVRVRRSDHLVP
jgi:hypothetical protein